MNSIKTVFSKPIYAAIAVSITLFLFLLAVWFPNISFIKYVLISGNLSFAGKIAFLWDSLSYFNRNFTLTSQIITICVAVISGINIAMFVFYLKRRASFDRKSGIGFLGTFIGIMGFGCTSCNFIILSSILGISATAGFIGILPFGGSEIGIAGVLLLIVSIIFVNRKINNPMTCKINHK